MLGVILFLWGAAIAWLVTRAAQYFLFNDKNENEKNN
jgi:hypothetical protein